MEIVKQAKVSAGSHPGGSKTTTSKPSYHGVAYMGQPGSFCHSASQAFFKTSAAVQLRSAFGESLENQSSDLPLNPFRRVSDVFDAIDEETIEYGVVPYENSLSGVIRATSDNLVRHADVSIIGEIEMEEELFLLMKENTDASTFTGNLYGHINMLNICDGTVRKRFPQLANIIAVASSTTACQIVKDSSSSDSKAACIASKEAAPLYQLKVIDSINTSAEYSRPNVTRYFILRKRNKRANALSPPSTTNIESWTHLIGTSITPSISLTHSFVIFLKNEIGSIYKILSCFFLRGINVTRVASRPASLFRKQNKMNSGTSHNGMMEVKEEAQSPGKGQMKKDPWEYVFFVEVEVNVSMYQNELSKMRMAIKNLEEHSEMVMDKGLYVTGSMNHSADSNTDGTFMLW